VAAALLAEQYPARRLAVALIGSPRSPVPRPLAPRTAYFYAAGRGERPRDPIACLGSWGGWRRGRCGLPVWDRRLHRPGCVRALPLAGGHADYFRTRLTAADGRTNLQCVEDEIWGWLAQLFAGDAAV
jgi:hypothetical protein